MRKTFVIDLFCGAGGTSTAIFKADTNIEVIWCINHDKNAILSHKENYPKCMHFIEDIRHAKLRPIANLVKMLRRKYPDCRIAIWASLECTNYSKAKGGKSRDADSRSLADHLFRYFDKLNPDFVWIENVREFMSWGPLCEQGKPISRQAGADYLRWINEVKSYGFHYDWKLLNSANFGGYTTRERYFGQFAKRKKEINWPAPTHSKKASVSGTLFDAELKKWKASREVLDLDDEGKSIFEKDNWSENTEKRWLAGIEKFVVKGNGDFIQKYFSGRPKGKVISIDEPMGTVTTFNGQAKVKCVFLSSYYKTPTYISSEDPCGTITTKDRFAKTEFKFMTNYYSGGGDLKSIDQPNGSVMTIPKERLTTLKFIDNQYGTMNPTSIDQPNGTLTINPKQALVSLSPWIMDTNFGNTGRSIDEPASTVMACRKHQYLVNPQWFNKSPGDIDSPCHTLIARMDKAPTSLISIVYGECGLGVAVYDTDSPTMVKIKEYMAMYGIVDIKQRMLKIPELLQIQGFPKDYKLIGNQTEQKKFIGNSVEVNVGVAIFKAIDHAVQAA